MLTVLLNFTGPAWLTLEIVLLVRDRSRAQGGTTDDRGTRTLNFVLVILAILVANGLNVAIGAHSPLRLAGGWESATGRLVAWLGLALRIWSIVVLGRSFRMT